MAPDGNNPHGVVGKPILRGDGLDKVRGTARYVDDLEVPNCWHGVVVRSPIPHGKLLGLEKAEDFDWQQVVVVTPEDIKGTNILDMHDKVMPILATDKVLYAGEAMALVAAPTRELAEEAASKIKAKLEPLEGVTTLDEIVEQFKNGSPDKFVLCDKKIRKGDMEKGFGEADFIIENEYRTPHQEQLYLEPNGLLATPQDDGGVLIEGSLQCPYYVCNEAHEALGLPQKQLRVRQTTVGGAFGGKEEFPSLLGGYVALMAMKAQKPVKLIFDRHEDILNSTKRHPSWVYHKTGVKQDGTITAIHVDYVLDGGAYMTISDVVMYRGILHAAMGYRCENVYVNGVTLRTHTFPNGAFRGFGAPQATWAFESQIDELAQKCGMTPDEFRRKNCLLEGDRTPTGQILNISVGTPAVLHDALDRAKFKEKYEKCSQGKGDGKSWYGIGLAFFAHGSAFTGDGEVKIGAKVALELDDNDGEPAFFVRVSSTEMGQGAFTVLRQTTADGLQMGLDRIHYPFPDTALVPDSGPTVASRTTMVVGSSLYKAGVSMREKLEAFASEHFFDGAKVEMRNDSFTSGDKSCTFVEVAKKYLADNGKLRVLSAFELPPTVKWNQDTFEGDAYPAYTWGCNVTEVEIDKTTLEIDVKRVTATYDIGTVINPMLAHGQLEGGLTQAVGYAVMEDMDIRDGKFTHDRMQTYTVPTTLDTPEFDIKFVEFPYPHAKPGAKGVGEVPLDGLAPAIGNAITAATGVRIKELPLTPEKLFSLLKGGE